MPNTLIYHYHNPYRLILQEASHAHVRRREDFTRLPNTKQIIKCSMYAVLAYGPQYKTMYTCQSRLLVISDMHLAAMQRLLCDAQSRYEY